MDFFSRRYKHISVFLILLSVQGLAMANPAERFLLSGRVTDHYGLPLAGVNVVLMPLNEFTTTNERGDFEMNIILPGDYRVFASHLGYRSFDDTIRLRENRSVLIELSEENIRLDEIVVKADYERKRNLSEALNVHVLQKEHFFENNTVNFAKALEKLPGVHSMNIGAGFSKPVIRGLGYNRIVVSENGIKQEGQQWGADHGLEIDQFNIGRVEVFKGPMSLAYGSDAMGGVIEISGDDGNIYETFIADISMLAKSVNNLYGFSAMTGLYGKKFYGSGRFTRLDFGDYRVPADTVYYNTWKLPVQGGALKNTAGLERDASLTLGYRSAGFDTRLMVSSVYQKLGFFPGAHGIPSVSRLQDDGDTRNVDLPFSNVNHLKVILNSSYKTGKGILHTDLAWQKNHRQEWARFHTHYGNQNPPAVNPDLELDFLLNTYSGNIKYDYRRQENYSLLMGINSQYQDNAIEGYNFLLPRYNRLGIGTFLIQKYRFNDRLLLVGGIRYDKGQIKIESFRDTVLFNFLSGTGLYDPQETDSYANRSREVNRQFGDFTWSAGLVYQAGGENVFKANIGKGYRLPGANELAANGVHHGTFRHESGNASLLSESGYQVDIGYFSNSGKFSYSLSPFLSWFENYIYLNPSGRWSVLPHAGQVYEYQSARVLMTGGEASLGYSLAENTSMEANLEYVFMQNLSDGYPLPFSPPASVSGLFYHKIPGRRSGQNLAGVQVHYRYVFDQNRIARNEEITPGYHLLDAGVHYNMVIRDQQLQLYFSVQNILNTRYFNHLSFYRKINIPEPGRNFQVIIRIPIMQDSFIY